MQSQKKLTAARALSALAAGALLALGVAGGAAAAPSDTTIDPKQTGSITIHKFEKPPATGAAGNGKIQDTTGLTPLPDVTFSIAQVDPSIYDLTTNAGWSALASLTPGAAAAGTKLEKGPVTTAADGTASLANLPIGVYLVTETGVPAGVTPGAPFLITLPMTDPDVQNAWMYNVHVYPKNSKVGGGTKTVDEEGATKVGDVLTWTILGDIPNSEVIDGYRIVDPLDDRLTYQSTAVSLDNGVALLPTDYTVTVTDAPSAKVTVTFTAAGLLKLAANNTAHVKVVIKTIINTAGEIPNSAIIYPNLPSFDIKPGEPGGPVVTPEIPVAKYGNVTIEKVSSKSAGTKLKGAVFQIYTSEADAKSGDTAKAITLGDPAVSSWTTDDSGRLTISGLRQSAWYNGGPVADTDAGFQYYWIVETKAPAGYSLLAEPVRVTVGDLDEVVDFTVEDSPSNGGFQLPFTGSVMSAGLFYGGGAVILLGAALLIIRARRKVATEA